jgi:uncharacterized membrane protein (UPF0127 family)
VSQPTQKPKSNIIWIISATFLAALLVFVGVQTYRQQATGMLFPKSHVEILRADGTNAAFKMEIATTPEQQEHGLMFRKHLKPDAGMLFLWPHAQHVSMWMKDTLIPLDMLFLADDGKIIKIAANAVPEDLTPLSSDTDARAVIEIGGGEAAKQNIKVDDKVLYAAFVAKP